MAFAPRSVGHLHRMMIERNTTLMAICLWYLTSSTLSVQAESILERIERTGELTAGARVDAIPFGYETAQGEWTGYSVELIKLIQLSLQKRLNKPIKLNLQPVSVENRFTVVEEEKGDLVCGVTTITQQRLEKVDFSIPYFMTGAQFLVRETESNQVNINGTLAQVAIAYIPNTTTDQIIRQIYPFANWQAVANRAEGISLLRKGTVKAVVSDGILLIGEVVQQGENPKSFTLLPSVPMTTELYGCMMPKNNANWKAFVDQTIGSEENRQLQNKWFNLETGPFPYILPYVIRTQP